jgi:hypothetical protein
MKAVFLISSASHWMSQPHTWRVMMSRVEYLFDLEIQHRKSRLLRPSQQLFFRRAYWWVRLQWITLKWKIRQQKKN